jgi:hypothetical protein
MTPEFAAGYLAGASDVARAVLTGRAEMYSTVKADLDRMQVTGSNAATMKATALLLARTIDAYDVAGVDTAAAMSAMTKATAELRVLFARLAELDTSARDGERADRVRQSTPTWGVGQ